MKTNDFDELEPSGIEAQVRQALRRDPAATGFADRVFAKTTRRPSVIRAIAGWWRRPALAWSLTAVMVAGTVAGTETWHVHQQRVEGERAKQQLMFALKITASKIQFAESKLRPESNQ